MTAIFGPALELVREFHRDKGLPISDDLETAPSRPQLWAIGKRVVEEAVELRAAVGAGDFAEVIKELADVVYSSLGVVVAYDLPVDEAFRERLGDMPEPSPPGAGPLATAISLARLREPATQDPVRLCEEIVVGSMDLRDELARRDTRKASHELARVLVDALHLTIVTDLPLDEAFLDIHENNMTKRPARRRRGVVQKPEKGPGFEKLDLSRLLPDTPERER